MQNEFGLITKKKIYLSFSIVYVRREKFAIDRKARTEKGE